MKKQYWLIVFFAIAGLVSCTPSKKKLQKNIQEAEAKIFNQNNVVVNEKTAKPLIEAYEQFAENYPTDVATPEYLFKLADVYRGIKQADKSLAVYDKILTDFPKHEKAPTSLFLKGFLYENEKQDMVNAGKMYQQFLKQYPTHELADDVNFSLRNLGKSPEELIQQFEQMNKDTTNKKENL